MIKKLSFSPVILLLSLYSCGTSHTLSDEASNINVAKNRPKNCSVVGKFKGTHKEGSVELARNQARNMASKKGATDSYFDEEINNGSSWVVHATGFMCK